MWQLDVAIIAVKSSFPIHETVVCTYIMNEVVINTQNELENWLVKEPNKVIIIE